MKNVLISICDLLRECHQDGEDETADKFKNGVMNNDPEAIKCALQFLKNEEERYLKNKSNSFTLLSEYKTYLDQIGYVA